MVAAIHLQKKIVFICANGRIFGDYVGTSKDMIKNTNRKGSICKGWYIIYLDKDERDLIYERKMNKQSTGRHPASAEGYQICVDLVEKFALTADPNVFTNLDYKIFFLTYNENPNIDLMYSIEPIENFRKYFTSDSD